MVKSDVLVIGSGISGLSFCIDFAENNPDKSLTLITKDKLMETNTSYAQGGIAVVSDFQIDSFEKHVEDTMVAGDYECDREVVSFVVKEGHELFKKLVSYGAEFDKEQNGEFSLGREGGHTANRIIHHKDITGFEIQKTLTKKVSELKNIEVFENHYAIDLITDHHFKDSKSPEELNCFGAYVLDEKQKTIHRFVSQITVIASGGCGQVYEHTTNPPIATGDGIGLAYRAKAKIKNMQYVQFHPTALYGDLTSGRSYLISEAVRGEGAKLLTKDGKPFMQKYDPREELASRDIVARAIDNELKTRGDEYVYLDCTAFGEEKFLAHFPNIYKKCKSVGIDPLKDYIPVVPAAHYHCGGIAVDYFGQSSMNNLMAIGECTYTGLHGANRLASNSLLEGLVYGNRCAKKSAQILNSEKPSQRIDEVPAWNEDNMKVPEEMVLIKFLKKELQSMMSDLVGIVRSNRRLQLADIKGKNIYLATKELYDMSILTPQLCELRNMINVVYLIIEQSKSQSENKGAFYNKDLN